MLEFYGDRAWGALGGGRQYLVVTMKGHGVRASFTIEGSPRDPQPVGGEFKSITAAQAACRAHMRASLS